MCIDAASQKIGRKNVARSGMLQKQVGYVGESGTVCCRSWYIAKAGNVVCMTIV